MSCAPLAPVFWQRQPKLPLPVMKFMGARLEAALRSPADRAVLVWPMVLGAPRLREAHPDGVPEPELLAGYTRHYQTGAALDPPQLAMIQQAQRSNQGFCTTEFLAAAFLDLDWHTRTDPEPVDAAAFERDSMARIGLLPQVPVRHRTPYFAHSMGGEYAAGYYGYLWSAVLDSDAYQAFREAGDPFDPATARSFRTNILEKGGSEDPLELYRRFRGRDPSVEPLLRKRGLE